MIINPLNKSLESDGLKVAAWFFAMEEMNLSYDYLIVDKQGTVTY